LKNNKRGCTLHGLYVWSEMYVGMYIGITAIINI
jgi:hypothetical protein